GRRARAVTLSSVPGEFTRGRCSRRHVEGEGRALADLAREPDRAPVKLDKPPGQCQAQPGTLALARLVASDLAEFLEDRRQVFRGDIALFSWIARWARECAER